MSCMDVPNVTDRSRLPTNLYRAMSHRTSRSTSGALEGVDLSAVQANLRALGHDVDEAQLVVMLQDINIGQLLSRASRPGTAASLAGRRSEASSSTQRSVSKRSASTAQPSHASERSLRTRDDDSDGSSAALYSHISQTSASSASASLRHSGAYNSASGGPRSSTDDQARFCWVLETSSLSSCQKQGSSGMFISCAHGMCRVRWSGDSARRMLQPAGRSLIAVPYCIRITTLLVESS